MLSVLYTYVELVTLCQHIWEYCLFHCYKYSNLSSMILSNLPYLLLYSTKLLIFKHGIVRKQLHWSPHQQEFYCRVLLCIVTIYVYGMSSLLKSKSLNIMAIPAQLPYPLRRMDRFLLSDLLLTPMITVLLAKRHNRCVFSSWDTCMARSNSIKWHGAVFYSSLPKHAFIQK